MRVTGKASVPAIATVDLSAQRGDNFGSSSGDSS
jgi:hypothetical protein